MLARYSVLAALLTLVASGAEAQSLTRLRGSVDAANGDVLAVTTRAGEHIDLLLTGKTRIASVSAATLSDIGAGSYVGTAAVPGLGGKLVALEVHIFPEAMRGTGDGHYPFDLKPDSTMTNGAVGTVTQSGNTELTVAYKGGQQTVIVPPDAPVVAIGPGERSLLVPGAKIVAFAEHAADGHWTAARILAGKDGLTPPM